MLAHSAPLEAARRTPGPGCTHSPRQATSLACARHIWRALPSRFRDEASVSTTAFAGAKPVGAARASTRRSPARGLWLSTPDFPPKPLHVRRSLSEHSIHFGVRTHDRWGLARHRLRLHTHADPRSHSGRHAFPYEVIQYIKRSLPFPSRGRSIEAGTLAEETSR